MSRVMAIGLDSAEWSVLEPLIDAGELPNLAALRERAAFATLDGRESIRSEVFWMEMLTGRPATDEGFWGMAAFEPSSYDGSIRRLPALKPWWAFGEDLPVVTIDIPERGAIDPGVVGQQVVAWGGHAPEFARTSLPEGLLAEIDARIGPHPAFGRECDPLWYSPAYLRNATDALIAGARMRCDVLDLLHAHQPDWRLTVAVWSEAHSGGHFMWHGVDPAHPAHDTPVGALAGEQMLRIHRALDDAVGHAVAAAGDDTVVVFALHGMKTNVTDPLSFVIVPELLHRLHFGTPAMQLPGGDEWKRAGMPVVMPDPNVQWIDHMASYFADSRGREVRNVVKRATPRAARDLLRRARGRAGHRPGELVTPIPPEAPFSEARAGLGNTAPDYMPLWWYRPRWPSMRYFAVPAFANGLVRVNLRGREGQGIVDPDDYRRTCDEAIAAISAATSARTGRSIVGDARLLRADDPMAPDGPPADIEFEWAESCDAAEHPATGLIGPVPHHRVGEHEGRGFVFVAGPGVTPAALGEHRAADLPPTILGLLGLPVPEEFTGTSMLAAVQ